MLAIVVVFFAVAEAPRHDTLHTQDPVWDTTFADLNGDGVQDILAYCSDAKADPPQKSIAVFLAGADGAYPEEPSAVLALDPKNGTAFTAEYDGAPPSELVVANQLGAKVLRFRGAGFETVAEISFESLLPTATREPLFLPNAVSDLDGDGIDEWLVPVPGGYEIWHQYESLARVPAPILSELRDYSSYAVMHRLPAIETFALPGSDVRGIAFLNDTIVSFSYGPDWSEHLSHRIPNELEENWDNATALRDVNADGFPDLLVTQTSGSVDLEVLSQVYLAREPFVYASSPDAEFRNKGSFTQSTFIDVDDDEDLDLVFLSVPIGFKNIISYLFRKKVTVEVKVHTFENGGYGKKASMDTHITVEAPEGRERVAYTMGDFDGDGRVDAAIGINANRLALYRGDREDFLDSRPWVTLNFPAFGVARSRDLDGNGRDDIVLHHLGGEYQRRIEVIRF